MGTSPSRASDTLVVPLAGGAAHAVDVCRRLLHVEGPAVLPLAQVGNGGRSLLRRRYQRVVLVGAPPVDEIGFGLGLIAALATRPKQVTMVDLATEHVVTQSAARSAVTLAPAGMWQLIASAGAIAAQLPAFRVARPLRGARPLSKTLRRLIYLRPSVGTPSSYGGSVTHAHGVIRALRAEGVSVLPLTTDRRIAATARENDVGFDWHVVDAPRSLKAIPASAAAGTDVALVRAAVRAAEDADAIYQRHARFSLSGALLSRLTGLPLFLEFNGPEGYIAEHWQPTPFRKRLEACEQAALAAAARIVVVSEADRRFLSSHGVADEKVVVNPNGVEVDRFDVGGGAAIRESHDIPPDSVVVGFLGTFGPWHGSTTLARAFVQAAASVPHLILMLLGDGPELAPTRDILDQAPLGSRWCSVGAVQPSDVPRYLDACDILVAPHVPLADRTEFFGSPTKLFEYMAAGKAILASSLGQIGDVLVHGETAWLVRPGDIEELATGLAHLADAPELRLSLGGRARERAAERHTWQANALKVLDAYTALAAGR